MKEHYNTRQIAANKFAIYGGCKNYKAANGLYLPINCGLSTVGNMYQSEAAPMSVYFPERANAEAYCLNDNRYDIFSRKDITEVPLGMTVVPMNVKPIVGQGYQDLGLNIANARLYPQCFNDGDNAGDLVLNFQHGKGIRFQKLVRWTPGNYPTKNIDIEFRVKWDSAVSNDIELSPSIIPPEYVSDQHGSAREKFRDFCRGRLNAPNPLTHDRGFYVRQKGSTGKRGLAMGDPSVFYLNALGDKISIPISMTIRRESVGSDWYIIKKTIPKSAFINAIGNVYTDAVYTIYPDAHPETNTVDGYAWRGSVTETWAAITAGAGQASIDNIARTRIQTLASATTDRFSFNLRGIKTFDISVIGAENILLVNAGLYGRSKTNTLGATWDFNIYQATTVNETSIVAADYNIGNFGTNEFITSVPYASYNIGAYNILPMNAAAIAAMVAAIADTGIIKLGILNAYHDMGQVAPIWGSNQQARIDHGSADAAGEEPYLEITTGAAFNPAWARNSNQIINGVM